MKERPILFSGPMVNAILNGTKTQTRRVIANIPHGVTGVTHNNARDIWFWWDGRLAGEVVNRYGKPGERLWVRETFRPSVCGDFAYRADKQIYEISEAKILSKAYPSLRWKPSIFMPRSVSRISLEITNVRVERLQDISEEGAKAEGVTRLPRHNNDVYGETNREAFERLWDQINGKKHPWASNPWLWVVEFRRVEA